MSAVTSVCQPTVLERGAMSDDADVPQERSEALSPGHSVVAGSPASLDAPAGQARGAAGTPAPQDAPSSSSAERGQERERDEAPAERRDQPYLERVAEEERDWLRRQENLQESDEDEDTTCPPDDTIGRDYNNVSGGGSVFNIGGSAWFYSTSDSDRGTQVRYLRRSDAQRLMTCMVPPPSQDDLLSVLDSHSLFFLRGAEGTGRMAAALHALLAWAPADADDEVDETTRVGLISVRSSFRRAAPDLRERHGYVLEPSGARSVWDLGALAETMRDGSEKNGCRIVILVPPGASGLPALVVDHRPPPALEVFQRWLEYGLADAGLDVHLIDVLRPEIEDELRQETYPRQAAHLASRLVGWLKAGKTPDEIRAELPRRLRDDIRRRLDADKPVLGRCFMISAAVLNGLQETTVSGAALHLVEHSKNMSSVQPEELLPAWEQLGTWLDYAAASVRPAQMSGGGRTVRINPRSESLTLRVLWEDHPTIRGPLTTWLRELAEDSGQADVQMKAAHAAGVLATLNFEFARTRFVEPWAKSRKWSNHRLAAMMLESAVTHESDILPRVLDLLGKLTRGTRYERLTAARVYGSSVGSSIFRVAFLELRSIALAYDVEVWKTVAGSIGNLYSAETAEEVIEELAACARDGSQLSDRYISALAFVRLARIVSGNPAYPPLTEIAQRDVAAGRLSLLWRNALGLRIVTRSARRPELAVPDSWTVLASWVRRYDEDQVVRAVIDAVLSPQGSEAGTAGTARLRRSFLLNLWKWQHENLISRDLREQLTKIVKGA
jgi:hypothetical protein